jgi:hypothetical protein
VLGLAVDELTAIGVDFLPVLVGVLPVSLRDIGMAADIR